jgi:Rps23 Pro-64 3,4-dihydroxylase Tpa1-like proline 4-hydroxylase
MTAKQILNAFSETLMQDDRILSPRERELLMSILQNSRALASSNPETQSAVTAVIVRAVGETVAQRAFALLGGSIVEQILAGSGIAFDQNIPESVIHAKKAPQPPNAPQSPNSAPLPPLPPNAPQPPNGISLRTTPPPAPQPPNPGPKTPGAPQPPNAPQPPQPPHIVFRPVSVPVQEGARQSHREAGNGIGVLDAPADVRTQCLVLDEFLAPQELEELVSYTLQHEAEFQSSEVMAPSEEPGVIDYDHRRSRVLMDLGKHQDVILKRIRCVLPRVLDQLGIEEFPVTRAEAQITASNDGDFFREHSDDAHELISSRRVTFVYFFHGEPRQFEGGELRLHDSRGTRASAGSSPTSYQTIVPQQNQIVFFPCSVLHEITPVECPSRAFADSRFTLNGWLHK